MDILTLALRYLRSRAIAVVSLLFIAIGVGSNIVVNAVMDGFKARILEHIRAVQSDLTLDFTRYRAREHFRFAVDRLAGEMESAGGPIVALAPRHMDIGLAACFTSDGRYDFERKAPVNIVGVDWPKERLVMDLDRMLSGLKAEDEALRVPAASFADPFKDRSIPGVILGTSLAKRLGLARGGEIDLVTADLAQVGAKTQFAAGNLRFEVIGCYDSGNDEYDKWHVYVARRDFERLKGEEPLRDCRTIQVRLKDFEKAAEVKARLKASFAEHGLAVDTWEDENRTLLEAVRNERAMIVIILSFIILVAAGSILGILVMLVIEKTRDIGVLRSMGMSAARTTAVFWTVGALLGLVGSLVGLAGGLLLVKNMNAVTTWLNDAFGIEVFNPRIYRFKEIPTKLVPEWVAGVTVGAFLCAVVASLVPAWLASRLDPVKCLKHE